MQLIRLNVIVIEMYSRRFGQIEIGGNDYTQESLTALHLQKIFGIVAVHHYFNSLSLLEKFPSSSTSIIKKDNILSRNANLPVESVLQTALPTPRNTGLPFFVVVFPTCRKV